VRIAALVLASFASFACGSSLPRPSPFAHARRAFYEVPFPPPPGRVEVVPAQPHDAAVWVDGEWLWEGRRWVWQDGGWVAPPPGARFAPWETRRVLDGRLFFAPGEWVDGTGRELPPPQPISTPGREGP
jgi:hypothetical protein